MLRLLLDGRWRPVTGLAHMLGIGQGRLRRILSGLAREGFIARREGPDGAIRLCR